MKIAEIKSSRAFIRVAWRLGGVLAILATAGAWWLLLGRPSREASRHLQQRRQMTASLRALSGNMESQLVKTAADSKKWAVADAAMRERTSTHGGEAIFLEWVNEQSHDCGLAIRDFRPMNRQVEGEFECRSLLLSAHGSYEAICRFLDRLRTAPRMCRVTNMEISPRDADAASYSFSLQVKLFSKSEPAKSQSG